MTNLKIFKTVFSNLLDVASWFIGGLFANNVIAFVNAGSWTAGLMDLGLSFGIVVVFFMIKNLADILLVDDDMDDKAMKKMKKLSKKAKKKAKNKLKKRKVIHKSDISIFHKVNR